MPIKQCNAITIHKAQGATFNEKVMLNCHKIFDKSMFYTALPRITKTWKYENNEFQRRIY